MRSRSIAQTVFAATLLAGFLSGCGDSGPSIAPTAPSAPPKTTAQAHVVIAIPTAAKTATSRRPAFVSPATQSITVAVDGGTPSVQNLTAGSAGCTAAAAPPLNCTVTVTASPGTHTLAFVTFDQLNATGNRLSTNSLAVTFVAGVNPAIPVVLNGIPASLIVAQPPSGAITVTQNGVQFLATSTQRLFISALDADNNLIVGPGSPVITATLTNPSAGSGIAIAPVANNANAFTLTSTGFGNATLTIAAPTPGGTPVSINVAMIASAQTSTLAGTLGRFGFADGTGTAAMFNTPIFLAYDTNDGNLYVTDSGNCNIRQVNPTSGAVATIAGSITGTCAFADGAGTNAQFSSPQGVTYDANDGNLYVTDTINCVIRQVTPTTGAVVTIAGSSGVCSLADGTGTTARFNFPAGIAYDANDGNLYVTDTDNCAIRQVNPTSGAVVTVAGSITGACAFADGTGTTANFNFPTGVAYNAKDHNLYVTDTNNCVIRQVTPATGAVVTIAGSSGACVLADGTGTNATFNFPQGLAYDANDDNLYVTETGNCSIRQVNPTTKAVITIAGSASTRVCAFGNGLGLDAFFNGPEGIAFDSVNGNLYLTEGNNSLIRELQL